MVYPSEHEVFGLVPLEAILSGTPVVVADDSGCAEVVRAIDGGQVVPLGDAAALAQTRSNACSAIRSRWRAATAEAPNGFEPHYDPDVICAPLEAVVL